MDKTTAEKGHGETILLVDDEPQILDVGKRVLKMLGYHVLEAHDGMQAIEVFRDHQDAIALIIMDVVMPKMSGSRAMEEILKLKPDVKFIFCTGYDNNTIFADQASSFDATVITKPYQIATFSQIIKEELDKT